MKEPISDSTGRAQKKSQVTFTGVEATRAVPTSRLNRYLVVTLYCVALVLCGPLLNNWAPLRKMFVARGAYAEACSPDDSLDPLDGTCIAQQNLLARLPVVAQSLQFAFAIVGGFCKDWLGSRVTALVGFSSQTFAFLSLALANKNFDGYLVGFVFFGIASEPMALGLIDACNLFPGHEGTVIASMGTARSISFFCSNVLEAIYAAGLSYEASWLIFAGIAFVVTIVVAFVVPPRGYSPVGSAPPKFRECCDRAMWREAANPTYLLFVVYFTTVVLRMGFFSASSDRQIPNALDFFGVMVPLSFIPCPLFGYLADKVGHWFVVHVINGCMIGMYAATLLTSVWSEYLAVFFSFLVYSFQSSQAYCVIAKTVPDFMVGRLLGLCFFVAGILGLTNTAIFEAVNNSGAFAATDWAYVIVGLVMVGLIFLMALFNRRRRPTPGDSSFGSSSLASSELSSSNCTSV